MKWRSDEVESSYPRLVFAGAVAAFAIAAVGVFALFLGSELSGGFEAARSGAAEAGAMTLISMPFIACAVLFLGLPLGLVVEKICRRTDVRHSGTLLAFGALGVVTGLIVMRLLDSNVLIVLPAIAAALLGRAAADWLASRRFYLGGLFSLCAGGLATSLIWFAI
ncbi:hypothetical protein ABT337_09860 [Saccharopolyspora hirsuta]|uniref:hypothetical protein n=1 Tax=Saccharopolyspora hirsuta TaxID=1837 RepID=UPI00332DB404